MSEHWLYQGVIERVDCFVEEVGEVLLVYCFLYIEIGLDRLLSLVLDGSLPRPRQGENHPEIAIGGSVFESSAFYELMMFFLRSPGCFVKDRGLSLFLIDIEAHMLAKVM